MPTPSVYPYLYGPSSPGRPGARKDHGQSWNEHNHQTLFLFKLCKKDKACQATVVEQCLGNWKEEKPGLFFFFVCVLCASIVVKDAGSGSGGGGSVIS